MAIEMQQHYYGGTWHPSTAEQFTDVVNPATQELLTQVPDTSAGEADRVIQSARAAFPEWRRVPVGTRIQYLFKLKNLLEEHFERISEITTLENGKTRNESRGELRRAIENVEVACGAPMLMQGYNLEDISPGIDEIMIRQPLGVVAAITPFNFPAMIPFWFLPYAIACGNTFILKPSERVPLTARYIFELIHQLDLPPGVLNLLHGGKAAVNALLSSPDVRAVSFVGSTPVARYIYAQAASYGKRVQCQGGAKNHVLILPDADMEMSARIVSDSAFGCAGQRCLAVSVAVTVGEARTEFATKIRDAAASIKVGNGLDDSVQMGPVISRESRVRVEDLIHKGVREGARLIAESPSVKELGGGNFVVPTILDGVAPDSALSSTEIFGPVLSTVHVDSVEDGIKLIASSAYGNAASIFTNSGRAARQFKYEVPTGNVGVNVGVAAPLAYFPFSGWKDSFFGTLHGQGWDGVAFYTEEKVVIERWPTSWSRKF